MKYLPLANSTKQIIVDDEDFDFLNQWSWRLDWHGYAARRNKSGGKRIPSWFKMHRLLMEYPKGKCVDHHNGDKLDNRRENLRICTRAENVRNNKGRRHVKGVRSFSPNRYSAYISVNSKQQNLGTFDTEHQAAMVYDMWATFFYGEFARTNYKIELLN